MRKGKMVESQCQHCNKNFTRLHYPSEPLITFCSKECQSAQRSKVNSCISCNVRLRMGEGYSTEATRGKRKDYLCDSCRAEKGRLVQIEKIRLKRLALENLTNRLEEAFVYTQGSKKCIYCDETVSIKRHQKGLDYCQKCSANARHHKGKSNPKNVLNSRMRNLMNKSLVGGKGGISWQTYAGYSPDQLKKHLERFFVDGMGWHNMKEWHIDHIVPVSKFNYNSPDDADFKKCWALPNLRPMWARDNIIKSDKLAAPLQPSLSFTSIRIGKASIGRPRKDTASTW